VGYTEGFFDGLRHTGDRSADAVIDDLALAEQVRTVSGVLRSLSYNDQPVPAELPSSIGQWLHEHGELPAWVDRDRLERGCAADGVPICQEDLVGTLLRHRTRRDPGRPHRRRRADS
jgi:hypothetical protein